MILQKQLRMPLVALANALVILVIGKILLAPAPAILKQTPTTMALPPVVPLPNWQLVKSESLPPHAFIVANWHYKYIQNQLPLDIDMRYVEETDGDVKQLIGKYASKELAAAQPNLSVREYSGVGFYGVYVYQQQAYLDACINPRGASTFTAEQFSYNRRHYELQFNRLLAYLLKDEPLRERRCLWSHLSVPLNDNSTESAYDNLETAWVSWYKWWYSHFPQP